MRYTAWPRGSSDPLGHTLLLAHYNLVTTEAQRHREKEKLHDTYVNALLAFSL